MTEQLKRFVADIQAGKEAEDSHILKAAALVILHNVEIDQIGHDLVKGTQVDELLQAVIPVLQSQVNAKYRYQQSKTDKNKLLLIQATEQMLNHLEHIMLLMCQGCMVSEELDKWKKLVKRLGEHA